ncbi:MAG TPA: hypothetical protein VK563_20380 [Puia sp.]|nr:hypothetical protein [Puia sp.]
MEKVIHQGRNITRFRQMLGIKQDLLATVMGEDWNQKKVSLLEQKEHIEPEILQEVANALKVPVEAIKNFDEDAAVNIIANTFAGESAAYVQYYKCNFNPIDKVVELLERLIADKDEQIAKLKAGKK